MKKKRFYNNKNRNQKWTEQPTGRKIYFADKYVLSNPISDKNIKEMRLNMNDEDQIAFDNFLERNWGIKPPKMTRYDENGDEIKPTMPIREKTEEEKLKEMAKAFSAKMDIEAKKAIGENRGDSNKAIDKEIQRRKMEEEKRIKAEENSLNKNISPTENGEDKSRRRIIKNILPNKKSNNNVEPEPEEKPVIRNELLNGIDFDLELDDDDDDNNNE